MLDSLKHKLGPLPVWAWAAILGTVVGIYLLHRSSSASSSSSSTPNSNTVDPSSPVGATYGQEAQDAQLGIDPITGETYAQEQAQAASNAYQTEGLGSGGGGVSGGTAATGDPVAEAELSQIDTDIQGLSTNLASASMPLTDQQAPTFSQEISDVAAGVSSLKTLSALFTPPPATTTQKSAPQLGKGAIRLQSGPTKPTAPKGYKVVGQGRGFWEAVPVIQTHTVHHAGGPSPGRPSGGASITGGKTNHRKVKGRR